MGKLLVADEQVALREALCQVLAGHGEHNVVGQAENLQQVIDVLRLRAMNFQSRPDLLILDEEMPGTEGLAMLEHLRKERVDIPVLVISSRDDKQHGEKALQLGARGYVGRRSSMDELRQAIKQVLQGQNYLSNTLQTSPVKQGRMQELTRREQEIAKMIIEGRRNREIAQNLAISARTVDTHRTNIMKKLVIKTNAELVRLAMSEQWDGPELKAAE